MAGGYTECACRDCFEIAIGDTPVLCHACAAGCDLTGGSECSSPYAYGISEEEEEN